MGQFHRETQVQANAGNRAILSAAPELGARHQQVAPPRMLAQRNANEKAL
jgi:hypothetical protein